MEPGQSWSDAIANRAWSVGLRVRNIAKHAGILGRVEPLMLRMAPRIVRPPSRDTTVTSAGDVTLTIPAGFPSARSYASRMYEPELTALLGSMLRDGMTFVDIGANIGYYTLLGARLVGDEGRVIAFEPDPRNFDYLSRNVTANGFGNVRTAQLAVSDSDQPLDFERDPSGAEGYLTTIETHDEGRERIQVSCTTLDQYVAAAGWPRIDVIKVDVEGAEPRALAGMATTIRRNPYVAILVEMNAHALARAGTSATRLGQELQALGFDEARIIEQGLHACSWDRLGTPGATYNLLCQRNVAAGHPNLAA